MMWRKVSLTFVSRFTGIAVNLLATVIISQSLGAQGRGDQALLLLGVSLIALFTNITAGGSISILSPDFDGKYLLGIGYAWVIASALISFSILYTMGVLDKYPTHVLFLSILLGLWTCNAHYLLGRKHTSWFNTLNLIQAISFLTTLFLFFKFSELNLLSYLYALYFSHGITLVLSFYPTSKHIQAGNSGYKLILTKFIKHGGFIQLANLAQLMNYRFSFYLIESQKGIGELGVYSNALAVAEGIWLITRSIALVVFADVINLKNSLKERALTIKYTLLSMLITAMALSLLLLLPDRVFVWLFGSEFTGTAPLIKYLAPGIFFLSAGNIIAHYFSAKGYNYLNFIGSAIGLAITLTLGYALIPTYGSQGAAITASAAFLAIAIYNLLLFRKDRFKWTKNLLGRAELQM